MSGYVRLHRSLIGHPAFRNDAEAMAFAWMAARAAWKDVRVRYKGRPVELKRGQLSISQRDMAQAMDRDKAWVERLWKRLRAEAMIEVAYEAGAAVVTICNYAEYQPESSKREAVNEASGKAGARQTQGTEQRREEGKKETTPSGVASAKSSIPSDWSPPSIDSLTPKARDCAKQWSAASYATVAEAFSCYWQRTGRMNKDWRLTWCEWVIKEHAKVMRDQKFGNAPPATSAKVEMTAQELRERAEWFIRHGQRDRAEECRQKAVKLERGIAA